MLAVWTFRLSALLALGACLVLLIDALLHARAKWERRRKAQGGVYGVVVDRNGQVLGTYIDPLQEPRRATRVHGPGSIWTGSDPSDPTAWAFEGQAETEEDARHLASRARHLYVSLLPELREEQTEPDAGEQAEPWV